MARIGAFFFPGTGHLNPMTALARSLEQRGHSLVLFGIADVESRVRATGIAFRQIGADDYPLGTLLQLDQQLGEQNGLNIFRFTVERVKNYTRMILRDAPAAVRNSCVEALLVDEADTAGTVAEFLDLPFVSIACFPPLVRSDVIPPFCFGWKYSTRPFGRLRNRLGGIAPSHFAAPVLAVLNEQRRTWRLTPLRHASKMSVQTTQSTFVLRTKCQAKHCANLLVFKVSVITKVCEPGPETAENLSKMYVKSIRVMNQQPENIYISYD